MNDSGGLLSELWEEAWHCEHLSCESETWLHVLSESPRWKVVKPDLEGSVGPRRPLSLLCRANANVRLRISALVSGVAFVDGLVHSMNTKLSPSTSLDNVKTIFAHVESWEALHHPSKSLEHMYLSGIGVVLLQTTMISPAYK